MQKILERYCQEDVVNLSLSQAFYKLLDDGIYLCSLSTLYRISRRQGWNKKRTRTAEPRNRYKPTSYSAKAPNQVWSWDITYFRSNQYSGKFFYAYVVIDIYRRYVVHRRVFDADNADYAVQFLSEAFDKYGIQPQQLVVHSDNGASMKAAKTLALLKKRGVTFSHSRPRVSNDNPYSESVFKTLKYNGTYVYPVSGFDSAASAEAWLDGFVRHYNEVHRHRGIRMVTPGSRFRGEDAEILRRRKATIELAKAQAPYRWIQGHTLNCEPIGAVFLNPDKEDEQPAANGVSMTTTAAA